MRKISFLLFRIAICFSMFIFYAAGADPVFSQSPETLTIVTYYPSPFGVYNELRSKRMAIGDNYYKNSDYCWAGSCTNTIGSNADLVVEGRVGIGTAKPGSKLDVSGTAQLRGRSGGTGLYVNSGGNVGIGTRAPGSKLSVSGGATIGTGYNAAAAPGNGMIIEGNVGIGTTSPGVKLDVAGTAQLRGTTAGTGLYVNSGGNVGIGTTRPSSGLKLDVEGKVGATAYCDQNGNNCQTTPMTIRYSDCSVVTGGNFNTVSCPSGKVMTAIQSSGIGCDGYCVSFAITCCKLSIK